MRKHLCFDRAIGEGGVCPITFSPASSRATGRPCRGLLRSYMSIVVAMFFPQNSGQLLSSAKSSLRTMRVIRSCQSMARSSMKK